VVAEVLALPGRDLVLDGEALTLADDGTPRPFQETASRTSASGRSDRVHPFFFDLLALEGTSLVHEPGRARLARLDEVVTLVLAAEGEAGVAKRLRDGSLHQAVNVMPREAMDIARETRSIETALAWTGLAGPLLPKVVEYSLYKRASPQDFTNASLRRILGLEDRLAIVRLASVGRAARVTLFELQDPELKGLARGLTESELDTLSRYLTGLEHGAGQRLLRAVVQAPSRMQPLAGARVRDAVLSSRDQMAAVSMMLRANSAIDASIIRQDIDLALQGRVSPLLLWDKHPIAIAAAGLGVVLLALVLRRLLFARRPRKVIVL